MQSSHDNLSNNEGESAPSASLVAQNNFTLYFRVRYGECDAQGVVFNARYADYADIAATEYLRALIGDYRCLVDAGLENQVVSYHIDWFSSAKFDDVLACNAHVSSVGNTSFTFAIECSKRSESDWQAVAKMQIVYVIVDATSFKKSPIPDFLKDAFSKRFTRSVNQAG